MTNKPHLVDLRPENLDTLACCGVTNPLHDGRARKNCWLQRYFKKGLRAKVLMTPDERQCGYIEYLPGEYAWRGVNAKGYLFIHCIWTHYRKVQKQGCGRQMIEACVADARKAGMSGVAVVVRSRPWLAGPGLFLKNNFEIVDTAPPDYALLVRKLDPSAPDPSFKGNWETKPAKYGPGLTIIRSNQCPHVAKFAGEIEQSAREEFGITPTVVELKSHRDAQNAPTPYAVFSIIHDGRLIADHQVSRTRFRNIMRKLAPPASASPRR